VTDTPKPPDDNAEGWDEEVLDDLPDEEPQEPLPPT
jgi:hypothetical protein